MKRIILLLDMNSYFASVEQQANPLLRGRPVGVCAYLSKRGCIIAASIEAKKFGVKTGTNVADAKKLCPGIILVENEPEKYRAVSKKIFSILADYSDNVSPFSIDEAFVDLTGWVENFFEARELALIIKSRIKNEVGSWLKCSIGISFTNWLAKFAAEEKKPDGLTIIVKNQKEEQELKKTFITLRQAQHYINKNTNIYSLDTVFINRPLQHACGIASKTEARLKLIGINTLEELKHSNPQKLLSSLGKYGYYLWAHLNGIEINGWIKKEGSVQKSIGHSYCMPKQGKDKEYLRGVLFKLCEKTGRRLREQNLVAGSISSGWSYMEMKGQWRNRRLSYPIFTTQDIYREAVHFLDNAFLIDNVRMLAVSVGALSPFVPQMSFWKDDDASYDLGKALDDINDRYGEYSVYQGLLHKVKDQAQDRIGFRKSVEVKRD